MRIKDKNMNNKMKKKIVFEKVLKKYRTVLFRHRFYYITYLFIVLSTLKYYTIPLNQSVDTNFKNFW